MSIRHLDKLLCPASIAVLGAGEDDTGAGDHLLRNLLAGGFSGPILPVSPTHAAVGGILAYKDVATLPLAPDLALIADPDPAILPALIAALGAKGTRAVALIGGKATAASGMADQPHRIGTLEAARPHLLRLLGPASQGFMSPAHGLNASLAPLPVKRGRIGFISRQGALWAAVLDWAASKGLGFSHAISLGESADIDAGDAVDYLASDADTRAIVLCLDSVTDSRKFMSAARAAARNKPVVAVRVAGVAETGRTADAVWSAAFHRAGIVRVDGIEELFDAVETLSRTRRLPGERLAIVSGAEGPEALALDALDPDSDHLARLSSTTAAQVRRLTGRQGEGLNPLILPERAPPEQHGEALALLLADENVDAALVLHVPSALEPAEAVADAVIEAAERAKKNVLTCWLGRDGAAPARARFAAAGLPSYETPRAALRAFLHMVDYRRTQRMLMETPLEVPADFAPDPHAARAVISAALAAGRNTLNEVEAGAILAAYGLPMITTAYADTIALAQVAATRIGYPVALKIRSPDLERRRTVGGVALDIEKRRSLRRAAEAMLARVARLAPEARIEGFTVQAQDRRPRAVALGLGVFLDPLFGPIIRFGRSARDGMADDDQALGLPPLNLTLAADLINLTRVGQRVLRGAGSRSPDAGLPDSGLPDSGLPDSGLPDSGPIALALVKLSQLVVDLPQITGIEIDPFRVDAAGALARGARISIAASAAEGTARLAIRPYPQHLEEIFTLRDGRTLLLRPIRPEDEPTHTAFFNRLDPEDVRFRFFNMIRLLPHSEMARFTQIDYDRQMAFIATHAGADGQPETLGVVRTVTDPDNEASEFAIVVRSDLKGLGLGHALMTKMIRYCRDRGTGRLFGLVLRDNHAMRKFSESLGFHPQMIPGEDALEMRLELRPGSGVEP